VHVLGFGAHSQSASALSWGNFLRVPLPFLGNFVKVSPFGYLGILQSFLFQIDANFFRGK
jgi:hypothetical protein